jgi:Mrp family chromosome partitioning ATPase
LIDMLREQYDFVIFDSPPLLAVTDASVIAARVDGVILGLQITKRGRPAAVEATDKLDAIGAKILGVVVNGIGWKRAYAYRYGGNFGAQSRFYQIGTESELDGQGYIYGESVESDVIDADRTRSEPAALAGPTPDHGRDS